MSKLLALVLSFSLFASQSWAADAAVDRSGIWRAEHDPTQFYVLQQSGDRVVFVAMRGVELSGNTLRYSYGGNSSNWELLRIGASDNRALDRLKLEFESERRAVVYVLCDTCSVRGVWLQKVF